MCKEGFTGERCDTCAFGYRGFPGCVRCECDAAGSTNADPCTPCTCKVNTHLSRPGGDRCVCHLWLIRCSVAPQVNVMGAHCDLCKPGFYNLQENNPLGCTDCFCFGVSDVCESSAWSTAQVRVIHLYTRATTVQQVLTLFCCSGASHGCLAPPPAGSEHHSHPGQRFTRQHFLWPLPPGRSAVGRTWRFPW